ncbi:hypothetical protein AAG612_04005 [Citromicrobium bathyomarinum]|mgnify:CR=1 FL=1|uniref:hypothetical protein n=1 Tax=Citromicrobium bathyomarinum TaxID=72174 RepID=UPI00315AA10A
MMIQAMIASAMMLQSPQMATQDQMQPVAQVKTETDPAKLLNLGVELAIAGETEAARVAFEKVRAMRVDYTLETTDGRFVYPADLARDGLKMLENGDFAARRDKIASR